ncbi:MAG: hypothetical protein ACE37B_19185 [Ilumatobacter sp.]|jgi:hypothetical protein|uniref:hypothetical protein n=1 Tax=Ilumatobacter sp. TaxID=1967498 RepID=UPI00391BEFA1
MRPPDCEICDARFDPAVGGDLVRFQPDERSEAWRERAETVGFVGHPPDTGWFCADHLDVARRVAARCSMPEGLTLIRTGVEDRGVEDRGVDPDLGAGRLGAEPALEERWVEWAIGPHDAGVLYDAMCHLVPELYAALDLGEVPRTERGRDRHWTPMDGAQPPYCPFTDRFTTRGRDRADGLLVEMVLEHWNDDDVNSASVTLAVGRDVYVSAFGENGAGRTISRVRLYRPLTPAAVEVVSRLAG